MEKLEIRIDERLKRIAGYVLFFLVITHGYRYFSPMYSHDSLAFAAESDAVWKISLGRFMQPVYWKFRGQIAAPYIAGILTCLWMTLSVYGVCDLLNMKSRTAHFLTAGTMTGSIALVCTNVAYIHEADLFMLALFLNVLSAWLCLKRVRILWIAVPVLLMISAGVYQAYLQVYVALVMIWAVMQILEQEEQDLRKTLLKCVKAAALLLVGMASYAIAWRYILQATGIRPESGYNGLTGVGNYEGISILKLLKETWVYPFDYLMHVKSRNRWMVLGPRILILAYTLAAVLYALVCRRRSVPAAATALAVMALLPAGMNCMYVVSKGLIHDLIIYAFCLADVFSIAVVDHACRLLLRKEKQNRCCRLRKSMICVFLMLFGMVFFDKTLYANQIYLKKDLEYDATLSVMTRVIDRLEQQEGYQPGETPVVLYGEIGASPISQESKAFSGTKSVTGMHDNYATTYEDTYWWYFEDVLGYPIVRGDGYDKARVYDRAANMPAFPEKGSVAVIDGVGVIRFSR